MTIDIQKMVQRASRLAEQKFAKSGEIDPVWIAVTAQDDAFVIPGMIPDKDLQAMMVRAIFAERDVVAYVFVDEAWVVMADTKNADEVTHHAMRHGLANHPDRKEVVVIHAEAAISSISSHRDIIRPARGSAYLGPLIIHHDIKSSEGRFVGLLPRRGTLQ